MQFIYCELNAFIFLKSLQLFLSELSVNHFQITKYQLCSNLFLYFRKQTCLLLRDWLYHVLPKQCYMFVIKRKSKTQTSLLKEIFKSHIDWLIFFPILGQILGNKTLEKWFFSSILIMIGQSCFLRLSIDRIIFRSNRNFYKTSSRSQVIKITWGKWRDFQKIYLNSSVLKQI